MSLHVGFLQQFELILDDACCPTSHLGIVPRCGCILVSPFSVLGFEVNRSPAGLVVEGQPFPHRCQTGNATWLANGFFDSLGIVRELGPIMAGVIMAGRTGAAFAAYIGTMKVNEEIDALQTLGIHPIDYLVLPRALALMLMMPLITLYANLMGIIGGTLVSVATLDVSMVLFLEQLRSAIGIVDVLGGLFMASVFGVLVALSGCQKGIECGTSAQAVGEATTSAVVTGIVAIVASCSVLNFIYTVLGI